MPAVPPVTTTYSIPRYEGGDVADFPEQWNAGVDQIDEALTRTAWIAFPYTGVWSNSGVLQDFKYRKDPLGYLELKGCAELGPGWSTYTGFGQLPAGYRVVSESRRPISVSDFTAGASIIGHLVMSADGNVNIVGTFTAGHGLRAIFDSVRFPLD